MLKFNQWMIKMEAAKMSEGKLLYIGAILDLESQRHLLREMCKLSEIPDDWTKYCHHMTVEFKDAATYPEEKLGEEILLLVTGWRKNPKGCAVKVEPMPGTEALLMKETQKPHITVACAPGVAPFYSNELLETGVEDIRDKNIRLKAYLCQVWNKGIVPMIPGVSYAADRIVTACRQA